MKKPQTKSQKNEFILITGASAGIGQATALLAAEKKQSLILVARRLDRLKKIAKECLKKGSPEVLVYQMDLQKKSDILRVSKEIKKKKLAIKVLLNNAGLAKGVQLFQESASEDWESMIETNIKGLLHMSKAFLPELIASHGHIINI